ncbi:DUF6412 domain-containing protein [Catellatospora sp. IY07-71]|uniref:DUF6412 domain-containing protein n=1 Tax=Catellatospora sp. IY07-71 TaxID=2728827 RepID=UPI001FD30D8F|nr:DUF6412 domain-containing protein [Catellatospora sp. IY07-71]
MRGATRWAVMLWLAVLCAGVAAAEQPGLGGVLASAAVLLLVSTLAVAAACGFGALPAGRAGLDTALRDLARRTGVLRQRDPDAAGRPRPRAPSRTPLAC